MTYQEFLNQFIEPISSFVSWLSMVANNLIHNYIFITFVGITLFISLLFLLYYSVKDFFESRRNNADKYLDKYNDYVIRQKIRRDFMQKEPDLFYENLYKDYVFKKAVRDDFVENNNSNTDDKIFSHWHDKSTGFPLSKAEEKELNDILEKF